MRRRMPKRQNGRGVLMLVATLFALSAIVRVAISAAPAIALEVSNLRAGAEDGLTTGECEIAPDIAEILADLQARELGIRKKEDELLAFEQTLEVSAAQVRMSLTELQDAETRLAALIALSEQASENDLARLTAVYENMKPKDAANLFSQMDPEFAAGFVGRMRPDAAAAIMTGLPPETAYSISVILAGRNAEAPTE